MAKVYKVQHSPYDFGQNPRGQKAAGLSSAGGFSSAGGLHSAGGFSSAGGLKDLYHKVLSLGQPEWEQVREKASQMAGNARSAFHPNIKLQQVAHEGKRKMFDFISKLQAPRIAARIIERYGDHKNEEGGSFIDQLHESLTV